MSRQLITEYRSELDRIHAASGSKRESVVREAFKDLLKRWGKSRDLVFLAEHEYLTPQGDRRYIDGALVYRIGVPFGYWEAKDEADRLDEEISKKQAKGYPRDNIIYEDTVTATLIQDKREVARVAMEDTEALYGLLERFFAYEPQAIADFRKAVKQFAADMPAVLEQLRKIIAEKRAASRDFARAEMKFLEHAREAINPAVSEEDVQEMLIQHVLTEDIFAKVFDNPEFHRKNNVAAALYALEEKLFGYGEKKALLAALRPYYFGIESTAALIESHSEKQQFLKGLYENFYKVYNPLAADRLGVVYTPGEIVRFMIRSADWLCHKHFGKGLDDRGVEILDPATGTGTFIVELLEHFRGNREKLAYKYKEELHANEVAILPYYVANLNIEATYQAITGQFAEFPGLVFVDTLDNVSALTALRGEHYGDLLGSLSEENVERIKRQNSKRISVIIGNPPYNASQKSENEKNKNREYDAIDRKIAQSYVKLSQAQRTGSYDMFTRFFRWATDRIDQDSGIVAFITNRIYLDGQNADGIRKAFQKDFCEAWIVDLGGDIRRHPNLSGSTHNVFGIQTGIAICFLVKNRDVSGFRLSYVSRPLEERADDKLSFLNSTSLSEIVMTSIPSHPQGRWLEDEDVDFGSLTPISQMTGGRNESEGYIFAASAPGVMSGRDEWVYSRTDDDLRKKVETIYTALSKRSKSSDFDLASAIKTSSTLERASSGGQGNEVPFVQSLWRPFQSRRFAFDLSIVDRLTDNHVRMFGDSGDQANPCIAFLSVASAHEVAVLATEKVFDYGLLKTGNGGTQGVSRYRLTATGERIENITNWALNKFKERYKKEVAEARFNERVWNGGASAVITQPDGTVQTLTIEPNPPTWPTDENGVPAVTKDAIFAYCYAVLHDPLYREKYALNLKREFPRIPFYDDFAKWVGWGQQLLDLHIGYERVKPFAFTRIDRPNPKRAKGSYPKPKLKSDPERGLVIVDEDTQITGIPRVAWDYRLGNRSAIDWVLDQHKEKTPRDPTVREKFNTYRFADYKESMIDLLAKVVTVSLETVRITGEMWALERVTKEDSNG